MAVKRVGIVGSGIMGSGIAEVAAKSGFEVVLRSRAQQTRRRDGRRAGEVAGEAGRAGQARSQPTATPCSAGCAPSPTSASSPSATSCSSRSSRTSPTKKHLFTDLDRICPEHTILATNTSTLARRRDGDGDRPSRQGLRRPLLQPGADDGARRDRAGDHVVRRHDRRGHRVRDRRAARTRCRSRTRPASS